MSGKEILFLAHRLPWPPDRGDRIRSWHMFRTLAALRPVHVVSPVDSAADLEYLPVVERLAASVTTAVRSRSRGAAVLSSFVSGIPASVALFDMPELRMAAARKLGGNTIGTVFAFSGQMARYVPERTSARFIMDFVDVDSAKFEQQGRDARGLFAMLLRREARVLSAFEATVARRADASLFVSEAETTLFSARTGLLARTIENGVDAAHFAPAIVAPAESPRPLIVFTGQMDYGPNIDAVTAFARDVMPVLPDATFAIVGRAPTAAVQALAGPAVIVTGEVADTRPWLEAASVVVAPLKLARGIQNKVLEAMAMGKAVVASSAAAEGIDAEPGVHLLVADAPEAQAATIAALLVDGDRARRAGMAARDRVLARYSWEARLAPLAGLIA